MNKAEDFYKIIEKPMRGDGRLKKEESHKYIFVLPKKLRKRASLISIERNISLASFIRESIENNVEKYKGYLHF